MRQARWTLTCYRRYRHSDCFTQALTQRLIVDAERAVRRFRLGIGPIPDMVAQDTPVGTPLRADDVRKDVQLATSANVLYND
jgi:hypothetical protein